jgi:hypothetical protein
MIRAFIIDLKAFKKIIIIKVSLILVINTYYVDFKVNLFIVDDNFINLR